MGILDTFIIFRIIKGLATPWDEWSAFKTGVIDASGKILKSDENWSQAQKSSYTLFDRLIANLKRLIEKIPGGKSKIGTYAAALYLLREQLGDEEGELVFEQSIMDFLKGNNAMDSNYLEEQYLPEETLDQGNYKLTNSMLDKNGNSLQKGSVVVAKTNLKPISRILGVDVYQLQVATTGKTVVVSLDDIQEI